MAARKRSVYKRWSTALLMVLGTLLSLHLSRGTKGTSFPVDGEVCFSPEESCDLKIMKFMQSAKKSLDIAIYDLTFEPLAKEILRRKKDLKIRILIDERQAHTTHSLVGKLLKAGIPIRKGRQRGIMHHKFMIVDGTMLETGSFNFTYRAVKSNHENQLYIFQPVIVERFQKEFERMWDESGEACSDDRCPIHEGS